MFSVHEELGMEREMTILAISYEQNKEVYALGESSDAIKWTVSVILNQSFLRLYSNTKGL